MAWVAHDASPVAWSLVQRVAALVGLPSTHAENMQVIRYESGQQYRQHWDAYDHDTERGARVMKDGGNRLITVLGYLNEVERGGQTEIVNPAIFVDPLPGRLLIFHNCYAGTATRHPDSLHAGLAVKAGTKWAFNLWFRERPTSWGLAAAQRSAWPTRPPRTRSSPRPRARASPSSTATSE